MQTKSNFTVIIDNDPVVQYETNSIFKKILNFGLIPILNIVPANSRKLIKKSHGAVSEVVQHATTHKAIEVLYKKGTTHKSKHLLHDFFHTLWFNTNNSKAVRNRLKLVKREIRNHLKTVLPSNEIRILSIAAGSARGIIEVLSEIPFRNDQKVTAMFLDKNPEATDYSKFLSKEFNLSHIQFEFINDTVGNFFKGNNPEIKYDIIEIVGLMDYFEDEKATSTFASIYSVLKEDGIIITANIVDNPERRFVTKAIGWKMIYRTPESLAGLLVNAGFQKEKMRVFYEPLKVHTVVVGQK